VFDHAIFFDTDVVRAARKHHDDAAWFRRRCVVQDSLKFTVCKWQVADEDAALRCCFLAREMVVMRLEGRCIGSGNGQCAESGSNEGRAKAASLM
jgi:hypothetical protein